MDVNASTTVESDRADDRQPTETHPTDPTDRPPSDRQPTDRPSTGSEPVGSVRVEGRTSVVVTPSSLDRFPRRERRCTVECASGERTTDTWRGIPIPALAERADFPGETTHLHVEADDFAAQVPISAALDGILAFDRTAGDGSKLPRLIAGDVPGERLVKRVRRVSAVELAPDDDPLVGPQ